MNKFSLKHLWLALLLILSTSACQTKVEFEDIAYEKLQLVKRNYLLISSEEPADVTVTFSAYSDRQNRLVQKELTTPCWIDLGMASVVYDSLNMVSGKRVIRGVKKIKHIFAEGGAEHLHIQNKSEYKLSLAIVGTQTLKSASPSTHAQSLVSSYPQPIYKGVPLLYLLRPAEAPKQSIFYNAILDYTRDNGLFSIHRTAIKEIDLSPEKLEKRVGEKVPFSVDRVLSLYLSKEYHLFLDYSHWSLQQLDPTLRNDEFDHLESILSWEIAPHHAWQNVGKIPLFAQPFHEQDELQ